jgi:hypothetical protein
MPSDSPSYTKHERKVEMMKNRFVRCLVLVTLPFLLCATTIYADKPPQMKMTTPIAPGVAVPDKIESSIGTLNLSYGYPSADTVEKI